MSLKRLLTSLYSLVLLLLLSSCSISRVHNPSFEHSDTLTSISVRVMSGRKMHVATAYIEDAINPKNVLRPKKYILEVSMSDSLENLLMGLDSTVVRKSIIVNAAFALRDRETKEVFTKGSVRSVAAFQEGTPFTSYIYESKAYDDAVRSIAVDIKYALVTYFHHKKSHED